MGKNALRLAKSKDTSLTKCVLVLKIMDMCPGKVKNAAPSGCALNTTEILYNKDDHPGPGQRPEFTSIVHKGAVVIYLSKSVNIKFVVDQSALRCFVIMPL